MSNPDLKNKPLVEAIFELKWELPNNIDGMFQDDNYRLLVGKIYDKNKNEYSYHKPLQTVNLPDDMVSYSVQHQFRVNEGDWPLFQIGPGILSLNDTKNYKWEDFQLRANRLLDSFYEAYNDITDKNGIKIRSTLLRYINAIEFDFDKENAFDFISKNLKIFINSDNILFSDKKVMKHPLNLDLKFSFPSSSPHGAAHIRFARGQDPEKKSVIIWELQIQSLGDDCPNNNDDIKDWISSAHDLLQNWFFKMAEGDLLEGFK